MSLQENTRKIAFFGTPAFTTRFLDALSDRGMTPTLIVTNPDRPAGRGMQRTSPLPKTWGDQHGVPVVQPEKIDAAFIEQLKQREWDLFVVIAYGQILPEALIDLPRCGTINVHYSLLPKYRGATPVESAILHGETITGVAIQQMRYRLDSGPILAQKEVPISSDDTTLSLRERLNDEAIALLPTVIDSLFEGTATPKEQDESRATFCKKIRKGDGEMFLDDDPVLNDRKFRAYAASPGTFFITKKGGKDTRVKIKSAHLEDGRFVLDIVIPENGRPLSGAEFARWQKEA